MDRTEPIAFTLDHHYVVAAHDGTMVVAAKSGPPPRADGLTFGFHHVDRDSGLGGELHPDGDELLVVLTGALVLELEAADGTTARIDLPAGHGCVVPRGRWHRLLVVEPATLWHATAGPGFEIRPLGEA